MLPVSGDLRIGGRYQLEGNAGGTVESCDPPTAFTWKYDSDVAWVTVTLTPDGQRTTLELRHTAHVTDRAGSTYPTVRGLPTENCTSPWRATHGQGQISCIPW